MSLPDEILDELLSAHLDGVLSGNECARVEQLLRDDPDVRLRFEQLKNRKDLFTDAALPAPKLPATFADSVVQAAIEAAQAEQLSSEHPLMLAAQSSLSESPTVQLSKSAGLDRKASALRIAGIIGGLAASLMIAGFFLTRDSDSGNQSSPNTLAKLDPTVAPSKPDKKPDKEIASAIGSQDDGIKTLEMRDSFRPVQPDPTLPSEPDEASNAVASAGPAIPSKIEPERAATMPQLAALLVIEVKLSDVGRVAGAFEKAMETVGIQQSGMRKVTESVASAAESNLAESSNEDSVIEDNQLVLLEAPIKDLDRLVKQLTSDVEGVQRLGFSMISNAVILRGVQSSRTIDPTSVQHQGQSWPITGEAEQAFEEWADQGEGQNFVPLPKGIGVGQLSTPSNAGPNPKASLLILVR